MNLSNQQYAKLVKEKNRPSPLFKNMLAAFFIGGGICAIGQGFLNFYLSIGLSKENAGCAVSITFIGIAALLTGIGVFDKIAKVAGAGTLVPITGFANAVVSPALEFKSEGMITGTAVKLFTVAGPVLVAGISASIVYGILLWLFGG